MKRAVALVLLAAVLMSVAPAPALAGSSEDAALALGAFAVFNQLVRGETVLNNLFGRPAPVRDTVVVHQPAVVYQQPVVYAAPPPPPPVVVYQAPPPVVVHPSGTWVWKRGAWVWVPGPKHHGRPYWR